MSSPVRQMASRRLPPLQVTAPQSLSSSSMSSKKPPSRSKHRQIPSSPKSSLNHLNNNHNNDHHVRNSNHHHHHHHHHQHQQQHHQPVQQPQHQLQLRASPRIPDMVITGFSAVSPSSSHGSFPYSSFNSANPVISLHGELLSMLSIRVVVWLQSFFVDEGRCME
ncbi:hypothetical protein V1264_024030 [Littorina saxatilis]|uniref:Uncharacterized protein n=1 Tax=Littorina saxatilis TaxID=31220 RepID=A0AAN9GAF8_9CAEN